MAKLLRASLMSLGLEMIDVQTDKFGEDLERQIGLVREATQNPEFRKTSIFEKCKAITDLKEMIFDRLGLSITLVTNEGLAAVMPFYSNKNHVFLDAFWRGEFTIKDQQKILDNAHGKKGYVNAKTAKVGGIFSTYTHTVYMNFHQLFGVYKLTDAEVTAIFLHENGHAFTACEYSDRLETNNQILASVSQEITSKKEKANVVYVYRELQKVNPKITAEETDQLVHGDKIIAGNVWMKVVVGSVAEQMLNAKYADTSFEQMSDNFAARFGYGRALVTGLDKLHLLSGSSEKSRTLGFMSMVLEAAMFIAGGTLGFMMLPASPVMGVLVLGIDYLFFRGAGEDMRDYTYDELKFRYKRVRQQFVEQLKNVKMNPETARRVLDDLQAVDEIYKNTFVSPSILRGLSNFMFSSARRASNSITVQQLMEELAHNDLFVSAAKLRLQ